MATELRRWLQRDGILSRFLLRDIILVNLLFVIALLVVFWILYKQYLSKFLQQGTPGKIKLGLVVIGVLFLLMAVTGRAPALFAILGAAMTQVMRLAPLLIRFAPSLKKILGSAIPGVAAGNRHSTVSRVSTATLDMTLDHATGEMDGNIKQGPLSGQSLSKLGLDQLRTLRDYCQEHDVEALRLVESYAAHVHAEAWQSAGDSNSDSARQPSSSNDMSDDEARQILGVVESATRDDIVQAHRLLMSRLHPDKGGSNYLAAKVNAAKELLLRKT